MYLLNNLKFDINAQHTLGDVQYPQGWFLDPAHRTEAGIIEVDDPVFPDPKLYTFVENPDGSLTITPRSAEDIAAIEASEVEQAKDVADTAEAKAYAKLQALKAMTPTQVSSWVDANVTTLAEARDAIKTLAIAVAILSRRI